VVLPCVWLILEHIDSPVTPPRSERVALNNGVGLLAVLAGLIVFVFSCYRALTDFKGRSPAMMASPVTVLIYVAERRSGGAQGEHDSGFHHE